ncbi:MAG: hypothetical protein K2N28_08975 [Muribaculaceae bacterium]|nr:hypothetical protein [Muribaculaceae bacterium]
MKKFIYSFAVIAALGLVACGGNKNTEAAAEEPAVVEETEVVAEEVAPCDSTCCADSTQCCEAAAEAAEAVVAE